MFLTLLMFLAALGIASISAYFSIFGLVALFSATPASLIVAGAVTEFGKLVLVSYVYRYRKYISVIPKAIIIGIIATVMTVTSIGVFGYLSNSYLQHQQPQQQITQQVERVNEKIASVEERIQRREETLDQFDKALDNYIDRGYITRGLEKREEQKEEREALNADISRFEDKIQDLQEQRSDMKQEMQKSEMEVGPIRYFAYAVYGESEDAIDQAVRLIIILLIIILDPFAVTILICANHSHIVVKENKKLSKEKPINKNEKNKDEEKTNDEINESDDIDVDSEENFQEEHEEMDEDTYREMSDKVTEFLKEKEHEDERQIDLQDNENELYDIKNHDNINDDELDETVGKYKFVENKIQDSEDIDSSEKNDNYNNDNWLPRN